MNEEIRITVDYVKGGHILCKCLQTKVVVSSGHVLIINESCGLSYYQTCPKCLSVFEIPYVFRSFEDAMNSIPIYHKIFSELLNGDM